LPKATPTAVTLAKHGKVPTLAAYDSGNLLSVATALHQRNPDKTIIIAGDDDLDQLLHRLSHRIGCVLRAGGVSRFNTSFQKRGQRPSETLY